MLEDLNPAGRLPAACRKARPGVAEQILILRGLRDECGQHRQIPKRLVHLTGRLLGVGQEVFPRPATSSIPPMVAAHRRQRCSCRPNGAACWTHRWTIPASSPRISRRCSRANSMTSARYLRRLGSPSKNKRIGTPRLIRSGEASVPFEVTAQRYVLGRWIVADCPRDPGRRGRVRGRWPRQGSSSGDSARCRRGSSSSVHPGARRRGAWPVPHPARGRWGPGRVRPGRTPPLESRGSCLCPLDSHQQHPGCGAWMK